LVLDVFAMGRNKAPIPIPIIYAVENTQGIKFDQKADAYYTGRYTGNVKVLNTVLYMSVQGVLVNTVCMFSLFCFFLY
jgi:hypothetical protein